METTANSQDSGAENSVETYAAKFAQRIETLPAADQTRIIDSLSQSLRREDPEVVAKIQAKLREICTQNSGAIQKTMAS